MPSFKRVAVVDRSRLSQNIFEMILKPFGYSLFFYNNYRDLKEKGSPGFQCGALLINSNVFVKKKEFFARWLKEGPGLDRVEKIFFCGPAEKDFFPELKKIKNSRIITKPFYPSELEKELKGIFK